jgi:allene oxide cyclase
MFTQRWVALCSIAVLVIGGAATAGATGPRDVRERVAISVVEHAVSDAVTDVGESDDSPGDLLTFANPVFDNGNDHRVGHDEGSCIRTSTSRGIWDCDFTTFLDDGQIRVAGPFYDTRDSVLAVTGGTGQYKTAHGTMALLHRDDPAEFGFVFHLVL